MMPQSWATVCRDASFIGSWYQKEGTKARFQIYNRRPTMSENAVFDLQTNKPIATIPLEALAGNTRYDPVSHQVFVSVQTLNKIVAINAATNRVVATYQLDSRCKHNHGLILDVSQRIAFVTCDLNATLLALDIYHSMQTLSVQSVGADPNLKAFDDGRHVLYVATHSGIPSVFTDS